MQSDKRQPNPDRQGAKSSIQVIERAMALLGVLARHPGPLPLKALTVETGLHASTAYRILSAMVDHRLVDRLEPGTYRLGLGLLELGALALSRVRVRDVALPRMQALQQALGETVHLSLRHGDDVIYVEEVAADRPMMRVIRAVGMRVPLHASAAGKLFLAADGPRGWDGYIGRTGLPRFTGNTLAERRALVCELERIRGQGYACDKEEAEPGVSSIGAGLYDGQGAMVAALSVAGPSERMNFAWAAQVQDAAAAISRAIGCRAPMGGER